jgi:hypothetical protein
MAPVLGGKVEEGKQRFPVLGQTGDRLVVLDVWQGWRSLEW